MMLRRAILLLVPAVLASVTLSAMAAGPAVTDPKKADRDFRVQGEYVGVVDGEYGDEKYGVQIIALGDGKFRAVSYPGGLPGAGWDQQQEKTSVEGQRVDGVATFRLDEVGVTATVKRGKITVVDDSGATVGVFKKVLRKSPTLGKKPPKGAVVLFDGKSAEAFIGGKVSEDGLLLEGSTSKQLFGSFKLHMEFRTPYMPKARGQGRGNSGFYAQGRYEVQILDSFGLEGLQNECGGIYSVGPPSVNMCLPPLSWQTYDVDYKAAKFEDGKKVSDATMTVRHNGVVIHKNQKLPHATTAAPVKEGPEPGPIYLQNHGNPVRFRNIWLTEEQ